MVTNTTGAWDSLGVMTPAVIKNGSTYNMWYTGINVNVSLVTNLLGATSVSGMETALLSGVNMAIGYATSTDGKAWTKNSGPVLQKSVATDWDSYCVFAPAVVMNADGTYDMWYTGGKGNLSIFFNFLQHTVSSDNLLFTGVNTAIGHATSPNGTTWVKDTVSNPVLSKGAGSAWDNSGVAFPSVVASGGYDYLWYTGITASPAAALTSFLNGNNVTAGVAAGSGTGMKIGYASAPIPVPPPSGGGGGGGGGYNPPPTTTTTTATTTITTTTTVITTTPSTSTTTTPVTTTTQPPTTTATTAPTVTTTTTTVSPRPASFEGSSLIIDPTTVKAGEPVNINLRITNVGDVSGIDTVVLMINNQIIDSKQVTLGGGENQVVTFTATAGAAGNYRVDVAGLTGTFTVGKKSVTAQSWFWPVIIGAFALAIIIGGGITLLLKRRV
jgi:hypothetical protein